MKIYAITIKPESAFGTPLKGDTLFGHFCWQAVHDDTLLSGGLDAWVDRYEERPFAVFSSAFLLTGSKQGTRYICLPKPSLPPKRSRGASRRERVLLRKQNKKKKWVVMPFEKIGDELGQFETVNDADVFRLHCDSLTPEKKRMLKFLPDEQQKPVSPFIQMHNSINRLTMTTGKDFTPFPMENFHYMPFSRLVIFAGIDEEALDVSRLETGIKRIGMYGFGRDASTGLGRFTVEKIEETAGFGGACGKENGFYVLAPCVPEQDKWQEQFAMPFTRFGRHGAELVLTGKPFKNPVVMADEGSVFFAQESTEIGKPYIGTAIKNLSLAEPRTIGQGYSLYLPVSRR